MRYNYYEYGITKANQKYPKSNFIRLKDYDLPEGCVAVLIYDRLLGDDVVEKYGLINLNRKMRKLTLYRVRYGMTQAELSHLTQISLRTIQGWEIKGMGGAALEKAYRVAKVLKCDVADLLEDEEKVWTVKDDKTEADQD